MMDTKIFIEKFYEKYGNRNDKPVLFFSPGRVNLIGEHTDYNGGFVFPCALNYGTYLLIRKIKTNTLKFSTINFNDDTETEIKGLFINSSKRWINYPLGVINEFIHAAFDTLELVKMSQKAENEFVGMNCGIMDQFAVGFGKKDHAIFLNCDTLFYENVPIVLTDCSLIITNTNKS